MWDCEIRLELNLVNFTSYPLVLSVSETGRLYNVKIRTFVFQLYWPIRTRAASIPVILKQSIVTAGLFLTAIKQRKLADPWPISTRFNFSDSHHVSGIL